jgi:plasmid stabilization system protein ParE
VSRSVVFHPAALDEILRARSWYEERQPNLGVEFAASVEATIENLLHRPASFPRVHGEKRRALVRRFPYFLIFRIDPGSIVVLAAFHGARDPQGWRSRS